MLLSNLETNSISEREKQSDIPKDSSEKRLFKFGSKKPFGENPSIWSKFKLIGVLRKLKKN